MVFADFHSVNTSTKTFKPTTWSHWAWTWKDMSIIHFLELVPTAAGSSFLQSCSKLFLPLHSVLWPTRLSVQLLCPQVMFQILDTISQHIYESFSAHGCVGYTGWVRAVGSCQGIDLFALPDTLKSTLHQARPADTWLPAVGYRSSSVNPSAYVVGERSETASWHLTPHTLWRMFWWLLPVSRDILPMEIFITS